MKRKSLAKILVLVLLVTTFTGCSKADTGLDDEEVEIYNRIKEHDYGAAGPRLLYGTDDYALILDFEGLIVYDMAKKDIGHLVDVKKEGFNKLQGADITEALGGGEDIVLRNSEDTSNYMELKPKTGETSLVDDIDMDKYKEANYHQLTEEELDSIKASLLEEYEAIETGGSIVVLTSDYKGRDKDWKLISFKEGSPEDFEVMDIFKRD